MQGRIVSICRFSSHLNFFDLEAFFCGLPKNSQSRGLLFELKFVIYLEQGRKVILKFGREWWKHIPRAQSKHTARNVETYFEHG